MAKWTARYVLPPRVQLVSVKIVRYFWVGAAAAALDMSLFLALTMLLGLPWFFSALISFVAATLLNYFLSVRLVFESGVRFRRRHEIMLVFAVSGVQDTALSSGNDRCRIRHC
jgi:putative flippase GtrA